jgi:hypothetical protein
MARAIHCNARLVRYWVAQERPISLKASKQIERLTRDKHVDQMRRLRAIYLNMIGELCDTGIRARLLAIDLSDLQVGFRTTPFLGRALENLPV